MKTLLILLIIVPVFFTIVFIVMLISILKTKSYSKYLEKYLKIIVSARYGNLNVKCENAIDDKTQKLKDNTNALLESIQDRDLMIKEYIEKEKESQNLKQDFFSCLAHDLKVPIIAQDNTYDLFLNESFGKLTPLQKEAIENLKISNNDLKNITLNILDAIKFEKTDISPNKKEISLNNLINDVIEENKNILLLKNKKISFKSNGNHVFNIDEFLFRRVLNNLISNAIFHGGDFIELELNENEFKLYDNGKNIKEEELKNILKKYYSASKKYENINFGLGLYIVNKIIKAHKAIFNIVNTKNRGVCFSIKFN